VSGHKPIVLGTDVSANSGFKIAIQSSRFEIFLYPS
jgi:hypothetical protein